MTDVSNFLLSSTSTITSKYGFLASSLDVLDTPSNPISTPRKNSILEKANSILPQPLNRYSIAYLLSGASSRMCVATLLAPMDTIKARIQFARNNAEVKRFSSSTDLVKNMIRHEGIRSFYRGLPARIVYVGPSAAISFLFYEQFRSMLHTKPREGEERNYLKMASPLLLAGFMRVLGTCLRTPFDVIREKMQVMGGLTAYDATSSAKACGTRGVYSSSWHALVSVLRTEPLALFAGVGVTILRDVPFSVIYFLAYECFRTAQQLYFAPDSSISSNATGSAVSSDNLNTSNYMLAGALASACSILATHPLDIIKVRLQTQSAFAKSNRYTGVIDCATRILKEEGARAFTRGLIPRMAYLCPNAALTFALYEHFKTVYGGFMDMDPTLITKRQNL